MAMADLTINYQREMVVDFTMPFLDLGISVLYVKAQQKDVNLFAFLSPLSAYVWLLMILAGISVSITMYFIARYDHFLARFYKSYSSKLNPGSAHTKRWS